MILKPLDESGNPDFRIHANGVIPARPVKTGDLELKRDCLKPLSIAIYKPFEAQGHLV